MKTDFCRRFTAGLLAAFCASVLQAEPMNITLSFDDGTKDHYTVAAPELEKRGWKGCFNIVTGNVGKKGFMTWDDLRDLKKRGHEIASHTHTHPNLVRLIAEGRSDEALADLVRSRKEIERELGVRPRFLCHPGMQVNGEVNALVRKALMMPQNRGRYNHGAGAKAGTSSGVGAYLDRRIARGGAGVDLLFHGIDRKYPGWKPFDSVSDFTAALDEVKERERAGKVRVLPYAEYVDADRSADPKPRLYLVGNGFADADGRNCWVETLAKDMLPGIKYRYRPFTDAKTAIAKGDWDVFVSHLRENDVVSMIFDKVDDDVRSRLEKDLHSTGAYVSAFYPQGSRRDLEGRTDSMMAAARTKEEKAKAFMACNSMTTSPLCGWFFKRGPATRAMREARTPTRVDVHPVAQGELRLTPTFVSCSIDWGAPFDPTVAFEWRKAGSGKWCRINAVPHFDEFNEYRGSLMGLSESTGYEVRVLKNGAVVASGSFKTWQTFVPVARTVEIDPAKAVFPIKIEEKGSADGWVRYVVKGKVLANTTAHTSIEIDKAQYVILEGIEFEGGKGAHAVTINGSLAVRIVNCEFRRWGRASSPDFFRHRGQPVTADGTWVNFDSAVDIGPGSKETVIERCWFHDPLSRANSWYYSHPAGPQAISVSYPDHSTVIRWCDMTGSDEHPWNDAVEGAGNFADDGGFNRDADIYGNFMTCSNDDSIELDGGMRNVRCFGNRFEGSACGVSIQGCMVSPVYVVDNLFTGMGEEHGIAMQTIKTSSYDRFFNGSWCYVADNVFWGDGSGMMMSFGHGSRVQKEVNPSVFALPRYNVYSNDFCGAWQKLGGTENELANLPGSGSSWDGNRFEVELAERDLDASYPKRPLPFVLDAARFSGIKVSKDAASPSSFKVTARLLNSGRGARKFTVVKNDCFDWFEVTPKSGIIEDGTVFRVTLDASRMQNRRHWRGSFLVRTSAGISRPVTLHAENTAFVPPFRPEVKGYVDYIDVFKPLNGVKLPVVADKSGFGGKMLKMARNFPRAEYEFEVPRDGKYFILLHGYSPGKTIGGQCGNPPYGYSNMSYVVDGRKMRVQLLLRDYPIWYHTDRLTLRPLELKAGRHTLAAGDFSANEFLFDSICVTDDLGAFEAR